MNADASPFRYSIDASDLLRIVTDIDDAEEDLLAIYHSHTRSPAFPSRTDVDLAFWPDAAYLIVSLASDPPDLRAFTIRDGRIAKRELGSRELVGQQVHQQLILPRAVRRAPRPAQHAGRLEPDLRVGADRALVGGGRVDHEAVVVLVPHELGGEEPDDLRADAAALQVRRDVEVHPGVPERRLLLRYHCIAPITVPRARSRACAPALAQVGFQLSLREEAPPALDGWLAADQFERRESALDGRTDEDADATQRNH